MSGQAIARRGGRLAVVAALACVALLLAGCTPFPSRTVIGPHGLVTPSSLVGTWATGTNYGTPEQPFVHFSADLTWVASDGCDRVRGTWRVERNGSLNTIAGPQAPLVCSGSPLPIAMLRASGVSLADGQISLRSWDNAPTLTLQRASSAIVRQQQFPIGYWAQERTPDAPFLAIRADGTFIGNDGCNALAGEWTSRGSNAVRLGVAATTRRACEGVDSWLNKAVLAKANGGTLTLRNQGGVVIGTLSSLDHSQG
jgi:heat shock protein HslJ